MCETYTVCDETVLCVNAAHFDPEHNTAHAMRLVFHACAVMPFVVRVMFGDMAAFVQIGARRMHRVDIGANPERALRTAIVDAFVSFYDDGCKA